MNRIFLGLALSLLTLACGPSGDDEPVVACMESDCAAALGRCEDGTLARGAGACIERDGYCRWESVSCDGPAPVEGECGPGLPRCVAGYCQFDGMCGTDGRRGMCRPFPRDCSPDFDPVCGCDGQSYISRCNAEAAGVTVVRNGECNVGDLTSP